MRILLLLPFLAVLLVSCSHKDYEEPSLESPVFTISGLRNGEPFTLEAGNNGLIKIATIERNKFGVMEWTSSFVSANCTSCEPEFSLTLNDREGVDASDCANLDLFSSESLAFATEASISEYQECSLSLSGVEDLEENAFTIPGADALSSNQFSFPSEGLYEVSASFVLEDDENEIENEINIHQTIYAGSHNRVAAPFLYELLENEDDEQRVRIHFPELAELRATHWDINGIISEQASNTLDIAFNTEYRIEIFYVNDITGAEGSYSLRFNNGFPTTENCDEEGHIMQALSINVDWSTGVPNYERAFITYRWQGKTYVSTTPLNATGNKLISILNAEPFTSGIQGKSAIKVNSTFSVTLVEVGNESNVLELTNCTATFGFVVPQ